MKSKTYNLKHITNNRVKQANELSVIGYRLSVLRAQVTLPLVLILAAIMLAIVSGIVFAGVYEAASITQERSLITSRFLLETGLQDALIKIAKDKTYNVPLGYTINSNDGTINAGSVLVQVYKDDPTTGQTRIELTATPSSILSITRRAKAILNVSSLGEVTLSSYQEY